MSSRRLAVLALVFAVVAGGAPSAAGGPAALRDRLRLNIPDFPAAARIDRLVSDGAFALDIGLSPPDISVEQVLRELMAIEQLADDDEPVAAAGKLQDLLDMHGSVLLPVSEHTYVPVWRYGTVRLLNTGGRLLRAYRRSYDAPARAALEAAKRDRSPTALLAVVRRYGATEPGAEALNVLASIELEAGRAETAANACRRRLMLGPPGEQPPAVVIAKLAQALALSEQRAELADLADAVNQHMADATVQHHGGEARLADYVSALARDRQPGTGPARRVGRTAERTVEPGTLLGQIDLPVPPPAPTWTPIRRPRAVEDQLEIATPDPTLHRDVMYVQSPTKLSAVDALTGRERWQTPINRGFLDQGRQPQVGWGLRRPDIEARPQHLPGAVAPVVREPTVLFTFPVGTVRYEDHGDRHEMVAGRMDALSISPGRQGAIRWSASTYEEARLETAERRRALRFVSPPTMANETIVVGARYATSDGDGFVLGYDSVTGRRLWQTHVASTTWAGEEVESEADRSRPIAHGGLVYYAGGLGTVAALDAIDGALMWLTRYPREQEAACRLETVGEHTARVSPPPNPPLVQGELLLALPEDSDHLLALDRRDGSPRWMRPRGEADNDWLFLLAADDRHVFVSGATVACLDVRSGRTVWRSVPLDAFPAGRGVVTPDHVMCPIEGGIALIDIHAEGRLAESIRWRRWRTDHHDQQTVPARSGNLTILGDRLVVTRNDSVSVFAATDAEDRWRRHLAEQPDHPATLIKLGALLESRRQWQESADAYRNAIRRKRAAERDAEPVVARLSAVLQRAARQAEAEQDWAEAAQLYDEIASLHPDEPPVAAGMLLKRAEMLVKQGDPTGALAALQKGLAGDHDVPVRVSENRTVTAGAALSAMAAELISAHGRDLYAEYEAEAEAARPEDVTAQYPNSRAAAELRLDRAREAIEARRFETASGELFAVERLCPGVLEDAAAQVRRDLSRAISEDAGRRHVVAQPLLETLWQVPTAEGGRITAESVADEGRPLHTGNLYLADRAGIRAHDALSGELQWHTDGGWLGVTFSEATVAPAGMPRPAVEIIEVLEDNPAERAGVKVGDLLIAFDGHRLKNTDDLAQAATTTPPGHRIELDLLRAREHQPGWHRLTIPVTLGERPERLEGRSVRLPPERYARMVGIDGDVALVDVDLSVQWIDRATGGLIRRKTFAPLPGTAASRGIDDHRILFFRGHRPMLAEGHIVAPTPTGDLVCFDLSGRDRWEVSLGDRTVLRMEASGGRLFIITGVPEEPPDPDRVQRARPDTFSAAELLVLDLFSGAERVRERFEGRARIGDCHLASESGRMYVAVPGRLRAYRTDTPEMVWQADDNAIDGDTISDIRPAGRRVLALVGGRRAVALDASTGEPAWNVEPGGRLIRLIVAHGRVMIPHEQRDRYSVAAYHLEQGRELWHTTLEEGVRLPGSDPAPSVPFAETHNGLLFLGQNLTTRTGVARTPTVTALRISDGRKLRQVGLERANRYNQLHGGKISGGVITLITSNGLTGLSAGEQP